MPFASRWFGPCAGLLLGAALGGMRAWGGDLQVAGPFVCRANFDLAPYAPLLAELASLPSEVHHALRLEAADEPVEVYLFADARSFQAYLSRRFPQVPLRRALFVKGDGLGMVFAQRQRELATDLRHEGTHALLNACLPPPPLWLDEGLAEYFEVPASQRKSGHPHQAFVRLQATLGRVPRLAALESKSQLEDLRSSDYRDSWAWVHFLLQGPDAAREELQAYLADLRDRRPAGLLGDRLRRRLPDLEAQFRAHHRGW